MADTRGAGDSSEQEGMLERLLTRLALTEDAKLESVLAKLLPYAISCLGSPHQSTKQKVMDMLTHINKRVKDQPSIKLPLLDLFKLYRSEDSAPMVKSFSLVYMEMAFDRRSKEEADLAPDLLENKSQVPVKHQDILLRMAVKEMEKYDSEAMDECYPAKCKFVKTPADRDIFFAFCLQTMIYQVFLTRTVCSSSCRPFQAPNNSCIWEFPPKRGFTYDTQVGTSECNFRVGHAPRNYISILNCCFGRPVRMIWKIPSQHLLRISCGA